jgi:hypothetical protein
MNFIPDDYSQLLDEKETYDRDNGKAGQGQWCNCTLRNRIGFLSLVSFRNAGENGEGGCSESRMNSRSYNMNLAISAYIQSE